MSSKRRALLLFGISILVCPLLRADAIKITLNSSVLAGRPGEVVTLLGSLLNSNGGDLFINGAGASLSGFGPTDTDVSEFVLNATGLLSDGGSTGSVPLLTVMIPLQFAIGHYAGILIVQGGPTPNDDLVLGAADFQVDVNDVPEPRSLSLVAAAVVLAMISRRRFWRRY